MNCFDPKITQQRIKELWQEKYIKAGVSMQVASELCGKSKNVFAQYIAGEYLPNAEALFYIAELYGVSADYLLGRTNERKPSN